MKIKTQSQHSQSARTLNNLINFKIQRHTRAGLMITSVHSNKETFSPSNSQNNQQQYSLPQQEEGIGSFTEQFKKRLSVLNQRASKLNIFGLRSSTKLGSIMMSLQNMRGSIKQPAPDFISDDPVTAQQYQNIIERRRHFIQQNETQQKQKHFRKLSKLGSMLKQQQIIGVQEQKKNREFILHNNTKMFTMPPDKKNINIEGAIDSKGATIFGRLQNTKRDDNLMNKITSSVYYVRIVDHNYDRS